MRKRTRAKRDGAERHETIVTHGMVTKREKERGRESKRERGSGGEGKRGREKVGGQRKLVRHERQA